MTDCVMLLRSKCLQIATQHVSLLPASPFLPRLLPSFQFPLRLVPPSFLLLPTWMLCCKNKTKTLVPPAPTVPAGFPYKTLSCLMEFGDCKQGWFFSSGLP